MMRKTCILITGALLLALTATSGRGEKPGAEGRDLMKKKLDYSQKVLEGIALNDFDKITRNADELIAVSKLAEWRMLVRHNTSCTAMISGGLPDPSGRRERPRTLTAPCSAMLT